MVKKYALLRSAVSDGTPGMPSSFWLFAWDQHGQTVAFDTPEEAHEIGTAMIPEGFVVIELPVWSPLV